MNKITFLAEMFNKFALNIIDFVRMVALTRAFACEVLLVWECLTTSAIPVQVRS
jgi:hypothetical protein